MQPRYHRRLPAFADQACGDPHALDDGRRLATYVLGALACLHDQPPPATAAQRRALWERAGSECDALSTSVLVAGLRPTGDGPLALTARAWAALGQAVRLTLAQLRADPVSGSAGSLTGPAAKTGARPWRMTASDYLTAILGAAAREAVVPEADGPETGPAPDQLTASPGIPTLPPPCALTAWPSLRSASPTSSSTTWRWACLQTVHRPTREASPRRSDPAGRGG